MGFFLAQRYYNNLAPLLEGDDDGKNLDTERNIVVRSEEESAMLMRLHEAIISGWQHAAHPT
jgi:hypothetical protein